jgi:phage virion morphogenesis protein
MEVKVEQSSAKKLMKALDLLALPRQKRKRLLYRVAASIRQDSKRNITQQKTPEGRPWAPRKRGKGKMLRGLKHLVVVSNESDENRAIVAFARGNYHRSHGGVVARVHNDGHKRKVDKRSRLHIRRSKSAGCSRKEAKMLKAFGFKVHASRMNSKAAKGKMRVPTVKWMMQNLSAKEVQYAFHALRKSGQLGTSKNSWEIKLPAREFLGASEARYRKAWERAFQGINYGWKVKAQHMKRRK